MAKQFIDHFIKNLHPEEAKSVSRYIKNNITNGEESKTLEVFEAMRSGKAISYKNTAALNKIKSRIFEKSLDGLMVDEQYIDQTFSGTDRTLIKLRKLLLQCKILHRPGAVGKTYTVRQLCEQIIQEAKRDELYDLVIEALRLKKYRLIQQTKDFSELEKINEEISFYDYCSKALFQAADDYHYIVINEVFMQLHSKKQINLYIKKAISRMTSDFKKTNSQTINYYLHILQFASCERKKDFDGAVKWCKGSIRLLEIHKQIYRKERLGLIYENLAYFNVYQERFRDAEKNARKAISYLPVNSFYRVVQTELEFQIYFYAKRFTKASRCIESLLKQPLSVIGEFRQAKYTYFKACLLFTQKKYKQSLALLINPLTIEKDKERWNISIRILIILIHIELGKPTEASRAVEALRKYIDRNKLNDKIRPRDLLIIKTLREMEKTNFEDVEKNSFVKKSLRQLSTKNKTLSWEYYSAEMIPFHEWLDNKNS